MKTKAKKAIEGLKKYRNYSIYMSIYLSNLDRMDNIAIEYRKNKITYREMFEKVDRYAASLVALGYGEGSEVVACISNTPEFIYMLLAISKIGAKLNSIGDWFSEEYLEEILSEANADRIFVTDDNYGTLKKKLKGNANVKEVVMFSLHDSLPVVDGVKKNLFAEIDDQFKSFDYKVAKYKREDGRKILSQDEFLHLGKEYIKREYGVDLDDTVNMIYPLKFLDAGTGLEDDFLTTYTSGTTDRPKATSHPVKSLAILSRFKESDVSGMPEMKDVRVYAHIPSYVLANISTSIIDPLYLSCTVIPEPIYDENYFPYGIILNDPNMSAGSVAAWRSLCMKLTTSDSFKKRKLPNLYIPIVTGEGMGPGEEKFFNKVAREHKFGVGKLPRPLSPVTFSIGGGTDEITGVFVTLFKKLQEKVRFGKQLGLTPLNCADVDVVDCFDNSLPVGEVGELIVKTECGMKGYRYDKELNSKVMFRRDGENWYRTGDYGVKLDNIPHIQIKGRLKDYIMVRKSDGTYRRYPLFKINDLVARDTKNILSSSVVKTSVGGDDVIVIHVEPQLDAPIKDKFELLKSIANRLDGNIPDNLKERIFFRYRSTEESFPVAPSGKRNVRKLEEDKLYKAIGFYDVKYHGLQEVKLLSMTPKAE